MELGVDVLWDLCSIVSLAEVVDVEGVVEAAAVKIKVLGNTWYSG